MKRVLKMKHESENLRKTTNTELRFHNIGLTCLEAPDVSTRIIFLSVSTLIKLIL